MAIALVAHTVNGSGGVSSSIDTTGANIIVVFASAFSGAPTLADSASNTWTAGTIITGGNLNARMWYVFTPNTSATHIFTATGSFPVIVVGAWSGVPTVFDAEQTLGTDGAGTTMQPGSITPAGAGGLLVTALELDNGASTPVGIDSGFTITDAVVRPPESFSGMAMAWKTGTTSATNPQWSWTNDGGRRQTAFMSFVAAGSGQRSHAVIL